MKCYYCDVYRGVSVNPDNHHDFTRDPLIFACKFSTSAGWEDTLALASEDGRIALQDTTVKSEEPHLSMEGTTVNIFIYFYVQIIFTRRSERVSNSKNKKFMQYAQG